ncbi:MAG: hypothetical protein J6O55_08285 [Lachnospiraceae bacterium]|nr:hypothetical protein [Lachnospiraceae bacterium]
MAGLNISIYTDAYNNQHASVYGRQSLFGGTDEAGNRAANAKKMGTLSYGHSSSAKEGSSEGYSVSQEMRQLIRGLNKEQEKNSYAASSSEGLNSLFELSGSDEKEEEEVKKPINYNFKEIAGKIQRAKTSVSAEQAYLSARRKVLEVKRKISAGDGDSEELEFALTHAKRMEMAARKKKHHLELEELAHITMERDEGQDKLHGDQADLKNAIISAEEEEISKKEDAIFTERETHAHEAAESAGGSTGNSGGISDDMMKELNELISEFGEEELRELEEQMEMLEGMETIDPHMTKEDLEKLKRRHREAENRAIVKADMDYLKSMIKHQLDRSGSVPGMGQTGGSFGGYVSTPAAPLSLPVPEAAAGGEVAIDIKL